MQKEATLKMFGTGQITIPKEWREWAGGDLFQAVLDKEEGVIKVRPKKVIEFSEPKYMKASEFRKGFEGSGYSEEFIDDIVEGFKDSSLCLPE